MLLIYRYESLQLPTKFWSAIFMLKPKLTCPLRFLNHKMFSLTLLISPTRETLLLKYNTVNLTVFICLNPLLEHKHGKIDNYFPNKGEHLVLSFLKHEFYLTFESIVSLQFLVFHNSYALSSLTSVFQERAA